MSENRRRQESSSPSLDLDPGANAGARARPDRGPNQEGSNAAAVRPSDPQRRYLERGLTEPGGKLPLFDRDGREVPKKTIEACITHGWIEPWVRNPIQPDWLVCRLTPEGYRALGKVAPSSALSEGIL